MELLLFNNYDLETLIVRLPIPVAARSKSWVCCRSLAEIVGSNPAGVMDVGYLCCVPVICVVYRLFVLCTGYLCCVPVICVVYRLFVLCTGYLCCVPVICVVFLMKLEFSRPFFRKILKYEIS